MPSLTGAHRHTEPRQASFDELGEPLSAITFVVVDLETTGGSPATEWITEIGAVKVRGGEVVGEFATLVRPPVPIPAFVSVLTGITDAMVAGAPGPDAVLPAFLEWVGDAVLVAHNAPFDLGFLRAGCDRLGLAWPRFRSLDTARLARRVLTRDEAPDCRLATLARRLGATTAPSHRALADARATVEVMHALFERLGPIGVHTWEELRAFTGMASAAARRKRHLAAHLPDGPGVYLFCDGTGRALYVGRSRELRRRVRQYFTGSEPRSRMAEMVGLTERVDAIRCTHDLEAAVREIRLIARHKPPYNRRSKFPERAVWVVLTREPYPRLAIVRRPPQRGHPQLGPFGSMAAARAAAAAVYDAVPLRQCTLRLSARPRRRRPGCALAELGRCPAPCRGEQSPAAYAAVADAAARLLGGDLSGLLTTVTARLARLSEQQRFETAAALRDRTATLVRAVDRMHRVGRLAQVPEITAARRDPSGGWELVVIRYGRLAGAAVAPPGAALGPYVADLRAGAEAVAEPVTTFGAAAVEETELILRWLVDPRVRLITVTGDWSSPACPPAEAGAWLANATARTPAVAGEDQRRLRPGHRPPRAWSDIGSVTSLG